MEMLINKRLIRKYSLQMEVENKNLIVRIVVYKGIKLYFIIILLLFFFYYIFVNINV